MSRWLASTLRLLLEMPATTVLGLLLLVPVLTAQDASGSANALRFLLVLPSGVPSEAAQIQYFATGAQGGYGGFLKPQPRLNAYELNVPGTRVKVIAYFPGCQFDSLDLSPEMPTSQALDCRPLRFVELRGQIVPKQMLAGKTAVVEVSYFALWAHEFFGIEDGLVPSFRVATAAPNEDGEFRVALPDFAEDAVAARFGLRGRWRFLLREAGTWNILARLKGTGSGSIRFGTDVRPYYPRTVTFTAVPN